MSRQLLNNAGAESFFSSLKKEAHQEEDLQESLDRLQPNQLFK
jgi:hypothetical protein